MRVKPKIIFPIGIRFLKNKFLMRLSFMFNACLYSPSSLIDVRITAKCNLRCKQCPVWKINCTEDLPTERWKRIILDIKNYNGPYFIRFYGGEPFLRSDFLELINFSSKNDILCLITTNGTLINNSIAEELIRNRVVLINISLDGLHPRTHDMLRGVEGTHQKVMKSIEYFQGKIPIQINTTIMEDNLDEILGLAEFANKNKIQISFQGLVNLMKNDSDSYDFYPTEHYLFPRDPNKVSDIIDELIIRKKYNTSIINTQTQLNCLKLYYRHSPKLKNKYCGALRNNHLIIKERADLFICSMFKSIGNLRENSLRDIWKSKEATHIRKEMMTCTIQNCAVMRGYCQEGIMDTLFKVKKCIFDS